MDDAPDPPKAPVKVSTHLERHELDRADFFRLSKADKQDACNSAGIGLLTLRSACSCYRFPTYGFALITSRARIQLAPQTQRISQAQSLCGELLSITKKHVFAA